ncbi:MAG TPA: hypothetical protein VL400_13990 [Polyangiaceae bacterium]|nr:hypothetical protein [Polyangiaceae bacterium]
MGSTVFANGNAVATSTTGHIAHVLPPGDFRMVPPVPTPTPLWNEVGSDKIYTAFPTKTQFQGGLVWVAGTQAGPLSTPTDGFPGQVSGAVNSFAVGQSGSGSKNVKVEARSVFCQTHLTWQNARNSQGMINDAAGAAAAKAAFEKEQAKNKPATGPDGGTGSKGGAKGDDGKGDKSDKPKTDPGTAPPAKDKCEVTAVLMTDEIDPLTTVKGKGKKIRLQNTEQKEKTAKIQVIDGSKVTLKATLGTAICDKHKVEWAGPNGFSGSGAEIVYKTDNRTGAATGGAIGAGAGAGAGLATGGVGGAMLGGAAGKFIGSILGKGVAQSGAVNALTYAFVKPQVDTVTCKACFGEFERVIEIFPKKHLTLKKEFEGLQVWGEGFQKMLKKNLFLEGELWVGGGEVSVDAGWAEEDDWKACFELKLAAGGTFVKGELRFKYSLIKVAGIIPAITPVSKALEAINYAYSLLVKGGKVFDVYLQLKLEGAITDELNFTAMKEYGGGWSYKETKFEIGGTFKATFSIIAEAIRIDKETLFSAEGYASFELGIKGELKYSDPPELGGSFSYGPVELGVKLKWNLLILLPKEDESKGGGLWTSIKRGAYNLYANTASAVTSAAEWAIKKAINKGLKDEIGLKMEVFKKRTIELEPVKLLV